MNETILKIPFKGQEISTTPVTSKFVKCKNMNLTEA